MTTVQLGLRTAFAALVALVLLAAPVEAEGEISISFDDVVLGPPGSVVTLAEVKVDEQHIGATCGLTLHSQNQSSVHIGNDIIVATGTSEAVILGVEDTPDGGTDQSYEMVVGANIVVELRFGEDGMSSLGFSLGFDCSPSPAEVEIPAVVGEAGSTTSTTAAPATTIPAQTTTTVAATTTSTPAVVAGAATNDLPETPAAVAVTGAPAYTG